MHDIQFIRENPEAFDVGLKRRGLEAKSAQILALDTKRRELVTSIQQAQGSRNELSKKIGELKIHVTEQFSLFKLIVQTIALKEPQEI